MNLVRNVESPQQETTTGRLFRKFLKKCSNSDTLYIPNSTPTTQEILQTP